MSLLYRFSDYFMPGAFGVDNFGDPASGRPILPDDLNKYMFNTMLKEYIQWHEENHRFYPAYAQDKTTLKFYYWKQFVWAFAGFTFAGMVLNPNYTKPSSFYLRKFNVLLCAMVGYAWGRRNMNNHLTFMEYKMNDYFPMEIKRALRTQDYRYIALFNYKNPDRKLFDDETGKSLS